MKRWMFALLILFGAWVWPVQGPFEAGISRGKMIHPEVQEVSGLVASHTHKGILWVHNDSGNEAILFGLNEEAEVKYRFELQGIDAIDWEDIALVPNPNGTSDQVWIADIGDNQGIRQDIGLYRINEPSVANSDRLISEQIPQDQIQHFRIKYAAGPRDAETFLYDPIDAHFYIITKRQLKVEVYRFPVPTDPKQSIVLHKVLELPFTFLTGGSISRNGNEILLKNLLYVYYWKRKSGESLLTTLQRAPDMLPYKPEAQGEAIDFAADDSGYWTLSERPLGLASALLFYPRR
jgi:hypothetical protein